MSEQNYHFWETSKENVLPLKQGRTVAAIEETFQQNSSKKGKINNEKTELEKRYFYARRALCTPRRAFLFLLQDSFLEKNDSPSKRATDFEKY